MYSSQIYEIEARLRQRLLEREAETKRAQRGDGRPPLRHLLAHGLASFSLRLDPTAVGHETARREHKPAA